MNNNTYLYMVLVFLGKKICNIVILKKQNILKASLWVIKYLYETNVQ